MGVGRAGGTPALVGTGAVAEEGATWQEGARSRVLGCSEQAPRPGMHQPSGRGSQMRGRARHPL